MSSGTARTEDIHRDPCMVPEIGTAATTVTFPLPNQWITGGCTTWTGVDWEDPNLRLASNRANPSAMKLSADAWRDHVNWPLGERAARTKRGTMFVAFQPAISKDAQNKISGQIRRWRLNRWIGLNLAEIARQINPVVRGWMQYLRSFLSFRTESAPVAHQCLRDAFDP